MIRNVPVWSYSSTGILLQSSQVKWYPTFVLSSIRGASYLKWCTVGDDDPIRFIM